MIINDMTAVKVDQPLEVTVTGDMTNSITITSNVPATFSIDSTYYLSISTTATSGTYTLVNQVSNYSYSTRTITITKVDDPTDVQTIQIHLGSFAFVQGCYSESDSLMKSGYSKVGYSATNVYVITTNMTARQSCVCPTLSSQYNTVYGMSFIGYTTGYSDISYYPTRYQPGSTYTVDGDTWMHYTLYARYGATLNGTLSLTTNKLFTVSYSGESTTNIRSIYGKNSSATTSTKTSDNKLTITSTNSFATQSDGSSSTTSGYRIKTKPTLSSINCTFSGSGSGIIQLYRTSTESGYGSFRSADSSPVLYLIIQNGTVVGFSPNTWTQYYVTSTSGSASVYLNIAYNLKYGDNCRQ